MRKRAATAPAARAAGAGLALRALPWVAALVAVAPLVRGGFPHGHDWTFELVRVAEYRAALDAGQLPPYWGENLYGGYGSPVFLFYAPLFSAGASLGSWLLGTVPRGAAFVLVVATFAAVPLARAFLAALLRSAGRPDPAAARIGAVFFVLHPYLLGDKLVRNADAEYLALCLVPLALAGVARVAREPRRGFALVSAGVALAVLAHNLTALVAVAFALGLAVVLHGRGSRATWSAILGGIAAGLALSAFFWLPALAWTGAIRPEDLLRGKFDYRHQFPPLAQLFGYARFFATGLATPAALAAALAAAASAPAQRRILLSCLAVAAFLLFLETRASEPLWAAIPWLPLFQFPWRMMGPLALVASALVALAAAVALAGRPPRTRALAEAAVAALLFVNAVPVLRQYAPIAPADAEKLEAALRPDALRNGDLSVSVGDEYLPRAADPEVWREQRPLEGPVVAASGPARWETLLDRGSHVELATHAPAPARLRLARFAFPGWRVQVDGAPGRWSASPWGTLEIEVPAGDARVSARLEAPLARRAALAFSGAAFVLWIGALAAMRRRARASIASRA